MLTRPGTLIEFKIQDIHDLKERIQSKVRQFQENDDVNLQTNSNNNLQENNSRILTSQRTNNISNHNNNINS